MPDTFLFRKGIHRTNRQVALRIAYRGTVRAFSGALRIVTVSLFFARTEVLQRYRDRNVKEIAGAFFITEKVETDCVSDLSG